LRFKSLKEQVFFRNTKVDYGVFMHVKKALFCIQKCWPKRAIEVPADSIAVWAPGHRPLGSKMRRASTSG
jgi:hypothetical protein